MHPSFKENNQAGFSIIEMVIVLAVMLTISVGVLSLLRNTMMVAATTYELTDSQESLRIAQEYINRDLINAGDGLKSMTYIPVRTSFVNNYLTRTPIADATMPSGVTNLGILTTDNNIPAGTIVPTVPVTPPVVVTVRPNTDRQTILAIDSDPTNIQYAPTNIDTAGSVITLPSGTDMTKFALGEIYFITSSKGGTFGAITSINSGTKQLTFANGDFCGINLTGSSGRIRDIAYSSTGTLMPTSLQRMRIIHYFVDSNGLLIRREFGAKGTAFRDSIIAEHVVNVQFFYHLDSPGQPLPLLTTPAQQVDISRVDVTITAETAHALQNGLQQQIASTTTTSLRNMQFRQALQPKPSPTP